MWGTLSNAVRQRAVPTEFQGRVGSVYLVGLFGGLVIGQGLGGVIADQWGLAAPFWFAFVGSGLTLALVWLELPQDRPRRAIARGRIWPLDRIAKGAISARPSTANARDA